MNQKNNKRSLIIVAVITAVVSFILSTLLFSSPSHHTLKAPVVQPITASFPDIKNDTSYNTFLNDNALDLTQPVQVGNTQNNVPFSQ